ncbi:MAG: squalene/phytoene synthase family protein [Propioniciclava sp.]|uniref:phytoene/squalene synthase family protein n=1 Tax=Propioniciclava sp. TaxID=2038686 RepID=UPI0039E523B1
MTAATGLSLYDRTADRAASTVIAGYSTSFGLACRLLGRRVRTHVRVIYALVRIADEIVDGPAAEAGLDRDATRRAIDDLEAETLRALDEGFSANLVVHAFARTARECGIGADLVRPFFASMRTDLDTREHDEASRIGYIYGSAEVVGLMCLQVFVNAGRRDRVLPDRLVREGARRLGAAFQEINFLRDAADDRSRLGRDYLGTSATPRARAASLARIEQDLDAAARCIPLLPPDCRRAVALAHALFSALAARLATAGGDERVRVSTPHKALLAVRVLLLDPFTGGAS